VQLADWGEKIPPGQVEDVLRHGTALPARGIIVFHWGGLRTQPEKLQRMADYFLSIAP